MMKQMRELFGEVAILREENSQVKASIELFQKRSLLRPSSAALGVSESKMDSERSKAVVIWDIPDSKGMHWITTPIPPSPLFLPAISRLSVDRRYDSSPSALLYSKDDIYKNYLAATFSVQP